MPDPRRPRKRAGESALDSLSPSMESSTLETALNKSWRSSDAKFKEHTEKFSGVMNSIKDRLSSGQGMRSIAKELDIPRNTLRDVNAGRGFSAEASASFAPYTPSSLPPAISSLAPSSSSSKTTSDGSQTLSEIRKLVATNTKILALEQGTGYNVYGSNPARGQWQSEKDYQQILKKLSVSNAAPAPTPGVVGTANPASGSLNMGNTVNAAAAWRNVSRGYGGPPPPPLSPPQSPPPPPPPNPNESYGFRTARAANRVLGTLATTQNNIEGMASIAGTVAGAVFGAVLGRFAGPGGAMLGAQIGASIGDKAVGTIFNVLKTPVALHSELAQGMAVAQPGLDLRQQSATIGRAGGFDGNALLNEINPGISAKNIVPEWMKLYGADPLGFTNRISQIGVAPRSLEETRKIGQYAYQQEAAPEFAGMPQGSIEELIKTITSTGMTGGKLTEGTNILSDQYMRKIGDIQTMATAKGMDRAAVLQSIDEGIRTSSSGGLADRGMIDLLAKITASGTAGAGTGQSQREVAKGVTESMQHWTSDPAMWAIIGKSIKGITSTDEYETRTGTIISEQPQAMQDFIMRAIKETNPLYKGLMMQEAITPSGLLKILIDDLTKQMGDKANTPHGKNMIDQIVASRGHITMVQAAALREQQTNPEEYYPKFFAEHGISKEAQKYAFPEGRKGGVSPNTMAAVLDASEKFKEAKTDEERQNIAGEIAKALHDNISKYGGPTKEAIQNLPGFNDKQTEKALQNLKGLGGLDLDANKTAAEAFQIQLNLSAGALKSFTEYLIKINLELEKMYGSKKEPKDTANAGVPNPSDIDWLRKRQNAPIPPSERRRIEKQSSEESTPVHTPSPWEIDWLEKRKKAPSSGNTPPTSGPGHSDSDVQGHYDETGTWIPPSSSAPLPQSPPSAPSSPWTESVPQSERRRINNGATQQAPMPGSASFNTDLQTRVMAAESGGNPNAVSSKGAVGSMQTMPGTLRDPGFGVRPASDPHDPAERARVGKDYLAAMQARYGNDRDALVAYNWGPNNADKWIAKGRPSEELPQETAKYISKIMGNGVDTPAAPMAPTTSITTPPPTSMSDRPEGSWGAQSKGASFESVQQGSTSNDSKSPGPQSNSQNHTDFSSGISTATNSTVTFASQMHTASAAMTNFTKKVNAANSSMKKTSTAADTNAQILKAML